MAGKELFTFAVYHTNLSLGGLNTIAAIYSSSNLPEAKMWSERWRQFQKDYLPYASQYIDTFFKSVRLVHSDCKCVVLSDLTTPFTLPEEIEIHRLELDSDKPAYMRLLAQREFLKKEDSSRHIIFMDYDMLMQKPFDPIFDREFDMALTYEPSYKRINGSFILIRKSHRQQGIRYYDIVEAIFKEGFTKFTPWGGIEGAMNYALEKKLATNKTGIIELDDIKIRILLCEKYNYSLSDDEYLELPDYLLSKMLLHFRGQRKYKMFDYWKMYLQPRNPVK